MTQGVKISQLSQNSVESFRKHLGIPNVYLFEYTNVTMGDSIELTASQKLDIKKSVVDTCFCMCLIKKGSIWTPVDGRTGAGYGFIFRYYYWENDAFMHPNKYTFMLVCNNYNGTPNSTTKTLDKIRIYFLQYKQ